MNRRLIVLMAAVVVLAAACSTSTTITQPDATDSEPAATAAADPTATAVPAPTATSVPEPTETPLPEPTATEPTASESTDAQDTAGDDAEDLETAAERLAGEFADDLSGAELACVFAALGDDEELASAALSDSFDSLAVEQKADLTTVMFECAPEATASSFSTALSGGAGTELPPAVSDCLVDSMTTSADRRDIIIGFVALGDETAVPTASQEPLIDTMVTCFPGATLLEAGALDDPVFEEAMDIECLGNALDGEAMRPVWTALVTNPEAEFEELDPAATEPMMNGMFSCMSFGRVVAAEAANDGVDLSEETISCIDLELGDLDFFAAMSDPGTEQEIGLAVLGCLSPEEAAQLNS